MSDETAFLASLMDSSARWISGKGPEAHIVLSSRIRLARNITDIPFPNRSDPGVLEKVKDHARELTEKASLLKSLSVVDLDRLGPLDREFLVERHLISREFAHGHGRLLLADEEERVAIMVNEEDHFRFQTLRSGLDIFEAWQVMRGIEREVDRHVSFAYKHPYGYLTSCPTNLGTGLRVSTLCHVPALGITNQMNDVVNMANQLGIAVRGFYGEGSNAVGNFVQFSNKATLGQSEDEILGELEGWARQIIERENKARERIQKESIVQLEDKVHRALGILTSARILDSGEMMNLMSFLRLGLDLGIVQEPSKMTLNRIQLSAQPAHLQKFKKKNLTPVERDEARAEYVRGSLFGE
ncbi:MAG: protein arginine kinase [Candidatus Lindowbacteria bacterium]|nr:protein arginine kinase [Candidatus Lindowbacteria bacterium]